LISPVKDDVHHENPDRYSHPHRPRPDRRATPKQWEATGGSKNDGVVQVSYELGQFESGQTRRARPDCG
jgi:hypothetical protein